jgi:hypothetical protein
MDRLFQQGCGTDLPALLEMNCPFWVNPKNATNYLMRAVPPAIQAQPEVEGKRR